MDGIIEHTLFKWPKVQVVTATKRRNVKYIHLEPVTKQPTKKPIFIPLTIAPISETKPKKNQPNNDSKLLKNAKHQITIPLHNPSLRFKKN